MIRSSARVIKFTVACVLSAVGVGGVCAEQSVAHRADWAFQNGIFEPPYDRHEYRFHTTVPTGAWRDRINDAAGEWNRHNRRFTFVPPGRDTPSVTGSVTFGCPTSEAPRPSIIYRADYGEGNAVAEACLTRSSPGSSDFRPTHFRIWFDKRDNYWWTKSSTKIPFNRHDLQETATHEFGHALGWLPHYDDDDGDQDSHPEYKSYCRHDKNQTAPTSNPRKPYSMANQDTLYLAQETMCAVGPNGSVHARTLHKEHDRGTFRNGYPAR